MTPPLGVSGLYGDLAELEGLIEEYYESISLESNRSSILENKILAAEMFTQQISKSITLINLYQPDSISPWITGNKLIRASNFLSDVTYQKVSIDEVNNVIQSFSDKDINLLTSPAIEMRDISISIPIYWLRG